MSDSQPDYRADPTAGQEQRNRTRIGQLLDDLRAHRPAEPTLFTRPVAPPPVDYPPPPRKAAPVSQEAEQPPAKKAKAKAKNAPPCLYCSEAGSGGTDPFGNPFCPRHWAERQQRLGRAS